MMRVRQRSGEYTRSVNWIDRITSVGVSALSVGNGTLIIVIILMNINQCLHFHKTSRSF